MGTIRFAGMDLPIGPLVFIASVIIIALIVYSQRERIAKTRAWIFLLEVRKELGNVTWPTKDDVINSTIVVIITTIIVALFIFAGNQVISRVFDIIREQVRNSFT